MSVSRTLFRAMLVEEWRLHSRLFGGRRFAGFPLFVAAMGAGAIFLLRTTGTDLAGVVAGFHALAFVVGLQTGTIGLIGHDSLNALLGDVTLLLSTSRTLPVSPRRILAIFVVKDLAYYAAFFMLPLALAFLPTAALGDLPLWAVPRLWVSVTGVFALGLAVTFAAVSLRTRGGVGVAALLAAGGTLGLAVASGVDLVAYTPYALYARPVTPTNVVASLAPTVALTLVGFRLYDPAFTRPSRTRTSTYRDWTRRLGDEDGLLTKTLFDVARSSGGLWKVPFSAGIILAVAVVLVEFAGTITGQTPAAGVSLGALLGLSAFTTYNWLTQFDSPGGYATFPVSVADVMRAKFRAFLLLGPAVGLAFYVGAIAWFGVPALDAVAGGALLVALQLYLFGVTTYLTGLQPSEFLFDTALFASFTAAVAAVLVPVLVAGFVAPMTTTLLAALLAASVGIGALGQELTRRARSRWVERYARS